MCNTRHFPINLHAQSCAQSVSFYICLENAAYYWTNDFFLFCVGLHGCAEPKGKPAGFVYSAIKQEGSFVSVLIGL